MPTVSAAIITPVVATLVHPLTIVAVPAFVLAVVPRTVGLRTIIASTIVGSLPTALLAAAAVPVIRTATTAAFVIAPVVRAAIVSLEVRVRPVPAILETRLLAAVTATEFTTVPIVTSAVVPLPIVTLRPTRTVIPIETTATVVLPVETARASASAAPAVVSSVIARTATALLGGTSALAVVELRVPPEAALVAGAAVAVLPVLRVALAAGSAPALLVTALTERPLAVAAVGTPILDPRTTATVVLAILVPEPVTTATTLSRAIVPRTSGAAIAAAVVLSAAEPAPGRPVPAGLAATAGIGSAAVAAATCVVGPGHQTSWKSTTRLTTSVDLSATHQSAPSACDAERHGTGPRHEKKGPTGPSRWTGPVGPFMSIVGGVLLSHTLSSAVPSALEGLASGFGMGPGVPRSAKTTDKPHTPHPQTMNP